MSIYKGMKAYNLVVAWQYWAGKSLKMVDAVESALTDDELDTAISLLAKIANKLVIDNRDGKFAREASQLSANIHRALNVK